MTFLGQPPADFRLVAGSAFGDRSSARGGRYSSEDLERLHRIAALLAAGVNLTGVAMVLDLPETNARLRPDLNATRPDSDKTSRGHSSSPQPDGTPQRIPASDSAATHRGPTAPRCRRPTAAVAGAPHEPHIPATAIPRPPVITEVIHDLALG
jgi:hypothetical protein